MLALFLTVHISVIRGASAQQRRKPEFPGGPVVRTWCFHCWGHRFDSWSQNSESASCGPKKKKQREPPLTLNMQKSPRVGCEPSVFWALATRRSLWLHHRCSQVLLGPCRLTPTWQESFHLHHLPLLLVCLSGLSSFPDIKLSFRWVSSGRRFHLGPT